MDANVVVILISLALFLAYISGIIYTFTGVPDTVWLIVFGYVFGPILHLFNPEALRPSTPIPRHWPSVAGSWSAVSPKHSTWPPSALLRRCRI